MLGLTKVLPKNFAKVSECFSLVTKITGQRTLFAPSFFSVDKFETHRAKIQNLQAGNKENIKSLIHKALQNQSTQIYTEDLKLMIYLTETTDEFNTLVNAIRKYDAQADSSTYSFGTPLMRLAYILNETDIMLDLFLNDSSKVFSETKATIMLMNKLFEDKRFDECITVFRKLSASFHGKETTLADGSKRLVFSFNHSIQIVAEALLEKNDSEALKEAKEIFTDMNTQNIRYDRKSHIALFLLAHQQGDFKYANEVLENANKKNFGFFEVPLQKNLEIINLCNLGKVQEAIECAKQLVGMTYKNFKHTFFEATINCLEEAAKKTGDQTVVDGLNDIIDQIKTTNSIMSKNMKEHFFNMQKISPQDLKKMREDANQFGPGSNEGSFRQRENFGERNESRPLRSGSFTRPRRPSFSE